jgi:YggT family protein
MSALLSGADTFIALIRGLLLVLAILLAIVCVVDWAVRTRRISPFNPLARFFRSTIDPFISPVERRVVRAGGLPSSAPLWALATIVIGGLLLLTFLEFLLTQLTSIAIQAHDGTLRPFSLLVRALFSLARIAIIVSVVASWLPVSQFSRWVRWSYRISEPILRPLRQFVPPLGGLDLTPLIAYFLLGLIESALFRVIG